MSKVDISSRRQSDLAMPPENGLSEPQQTVLFAIWKLRGIGNSTVSESQLKTQIPNQPLEAVTSTLTQLESLGFIAINTKGEQNTISITPLGAAILRKVEEDRLQEIK